MAFDLSVGGGKTVKVAEPARSMFPANLGGAVQFSIAHTLYKVLEIMGGSLGSFAAGFLVEFLERLEPTLVEHLAPLIDLLLAQPDCPPELRDLLTKLRTPASQADAVLLSALGGSAVSSLTSSVLGVLSAPLVHALNQKIRPSRPSPAEGLYALWREQIAASELNLWLKETGWSDRMINAFPDILRPRVSPDMLWQAAHRRQILLGDAANEIRKRGFTPVDSDIIQALSHQIFDEPALMTMGFRGIITDPEWTAGMQARGWYPDDVVKWRELRKQIPGANDLVRFGVREAFTPEIASRYGYYDDFPPAFAEWMNKIGYSDFWAKAYWAAKWQLPSVSLAYEMYHRAIISKPDLETLLRVSDYPSYWRDKMVKAAYSPYTRVDVRRMYGLDVLDTESVYRCYRDLGYDDDHARHLTEFTVKYEDENGADKRTTYRSLTYGLIEQAYRKDILTLDEAEAQLTRVGYKTDDINIMVPLMQAKAELERIPDWASDHSRDYKTLVEKAYTRRLISRGEASTGLSELGISERSINFILAIADYNYVAGELDLAIKTIGDAYVSRAIDRSEAAVKFGALNVPATLSQQHLAEWDLQREVRARRLTEAQYRKALGSELISLEQYKECLRGLGYTDFDVNLLVRMATD